jgi:uncharacterized protein Usg
MVSQDFRRQLEGYGLTTANILYLRPDHPWLLQSMSGRITISARHFRRSTNSSISGWRPWKARCTRSPWRMRV